jgi:hypothetical protein
VLVFNVFSQEIGSWKYHSSFGKALALLIVGIYPFINVCQSPMRMVVKTPMRIPQCHFHDNYVTGNRQNRYGVAFSTVILLEVDHSAEPFKPTAENAVLLSQKFSVHSPNPTGNITPSRCYDTQHSSSVDAMQNVNCYHNVDSKGFNFDVFYPSLPMRIDSCKPSIIAIAA